MFALVILMSIKQVGIDEKAAKPEKKVPVVKTCRGDQALLLFFNELLFPIIEGKRRVYFEFDSECPDHQASLFSPGRPANPCIFFPNSTLQLLPGL